MCMTLIRITEHRVDEVSEVGTSCLGLAARALLSGLLPRAPGDEIIHYTQTSKPMHLVIQ